MTIQEAHKYFGTWTNLAHALKQGLNTHAYWRKIGYIPYRSQLMIEKATNGELLASELHCEKKAK